MEEIICKNCGLVNDYRTEKAGPHIKAICNGCDSYIKFLPQGNIEPTLFYPKYKGRTVKSMTSTPEISYLYWLIENVSDIHPTLENAITEHLKNYPKPA